MSKGSGRRRTQVSDEEATANWEAAFGPSRLRQMVQNQEMEKSKVGTAEEAALLPDVPPSQETNDSECS